MKNVGSPWKEGEIRLEYNKNFFCEERMTEWLPNFLILGIFGAVFLPLSPSLVQPRVWRPPRTALVAFCEPYPSPPSSPYNGPDFAPFQPNLCNPPNTAKVLNNILPKKIYAHKLLGAASIQTQDLNIQRGSEYRTIPVHKWSIAD